MIGIKGKGTVRLLTLKEEEIRVGGMYIVGKSDKPNPKVPANTIVVVEGHYDEQVLARIVNTKETVSVKSSRLTIPVVFGAKEILSNRISRTSGFEIAKRHYQIAITCLDEREVTYKVTESGAEIEEYIQQTKGKKEATTSTLSADVQSERDRCIAILEITRKAMSIISIMPESTNVPNGVFTLGVLDFAIDKIRSESRVNNGPDFFADLAKEMNKDTEISKLISALLALAKKN